MAGVRASEGRGTVSGARFLGNVFIEMRPAGGRTDWLCLAHYAPRRGVVWARQRSGGSVESSTPHTYSCSSNTSAQYIRTSTYNKWAGLEL